VSLKVETRLLKEFDRFRCIHVLAIGKPSGLRSSSNEIISAPDAELEVELPRRDVLRKVSLLVCKCDPDLNEFQEVDITSHGLVVVIRRGLESTDRPRNNSWELSILHSKYGSMALDGYSCGRSTPLRHMNIDLSRFGLSAFLLRDWVPILLVFETCWEPLQVCSLAAVVMVCRGPPLKASKKHRLCKRLINTYYNEY